MKLKLAWQWIMLIAGIVMFLAPSLYPLDIGSPPKFPWIPEGYFSSGEIGYIDPRTGKYYLFVAPVSEKGVSIATAKVTFKELGIDFSMSQENVIERKSYDWYSFWLRFDVETPLEYNKKYMVEFYVEDSKGRSDTVSAWVLFKPVERLPVPEGYFKVNGVQAGIGTAVFTETARISITFTPTKNAEYIDRISVEVHKDGKTVAFITTQEVPNEHKFIKMMEGTYYAEYTLPTYGSYRLEGYVGTEQRNIKMMNATLNYNEPPRNTAASIVLRIAGILFITAGSVSLIKRRLRK